MEACFWFVVNACVNENQTGATKDDITGGTTTAGDSVPVETDEDQEVVVCAFCLY